MIKKIFVICVMAMGFLSHVMAQENIVEGRLYLSQEKVYRFFGCG